MYINASNGRTLLAVLLLAALALGAGGGLRAQGLDIDDEELIDNLRQGGYVIVMRHGDARRERPDDQPLRPAPNQGRDLSHLSDPGREDARAVGEALRRLEIPLGEVLTSPAEEAVETAELAGFSEARTERMLDNAGEPSVAWLREKVSEAPAEGSNTLLITHHPVILRAFPYLAFQPDPGEVLIIDPRGGNSPGPDLVTRVKVSKWEDFTS